MDLAVGRDHACGLRSDDSVVCDSGYPQLEALRASIPSGEAFVDLVAGAGGACAVRGDGTVSCFAGLERHATPADSFAQISVGDWHVCGLTADAELKCWGNEDYVPEIENVVISSVAALDAGACGTVVGGQYDGDVRCWGGLGPGYDGGRYLYEPAAGRRFTRVVAGRLETVCMLDDESRLTCYFHGQPRTDYALHGEIVEDVWPGSEGLCAKAVDGDFACTGLNLSLDVPEQTDFAQVSVGSEEACALYEDGQVTCWGAEYSGVRHLPYDGPFTKVAVGDSFACGLRLGGEIACWGAGDYGQARPPLELR